MALPPGPAPAGPSKEEFPVLVYALGQSPSQATTGSLVVIGLTSLAGAVAAHRAGMVLLARGATFGVWRSRRGRRCQAVRARARTSAPGVVLPAPAQRRGATRHTLRSRSTDRLRPQPSPARTRRPTLDDPILSFTPSFACQCPWALKVLVAATGVGLLTGFLGVGGGFLVLPALVLALAVPMEYAAGTPLVVIAVTSASALAVRAGVGVTPDWGVVLVLTLASVVGGLLGARVAMRTDTARLSAAFTVLVLCVAVYTAARALPLLSDPPCDTATLDRLPPSA